MCIGPHMAEVGNCADNSAGYRTLLVHFARSPLPARERVGRLLRSCRTRGRDLKYLLRCRGVPADGIVWSGRGEEWVFSHVVGA